MAVLDLSPTQLQVLCGVLGPLSRHGAAAGAAGGAPPALDVHELSMFLLAQLFSREAQRPDSNEVWPEAGPSLSPLSVSDGLASPTRSAMARSPSGANARTRAHAARSARLHTRGQCTRALLNARRPPLARTPGRTPAQARACCASSCSSTCATRHSRSATLETTCAATWPQSRSSRSARPPPSGPRSRRARTPTTPRLRP